MPAPARPYARAKRRATLPRDRKATWRGPAGISSGQADAWRVNTEVSGEETVLKRGTEQWIATFACAYETPPPHTHTHTLSLSLSLSLQCPISMMFSALLIFFILTVGNHSNTITVYSLLIYNSFCFYPNVCSHCILMNVWYARVSKKQLWWSYEDFSKRSTKFNDYLL